MDMIEDFDAVFWFHDSLKLLKYMNDIELVILLSLMFLPGLL